jgi:hypothetical protein
MVSQTTVIGVGRPLRPLPATMAAPRQRLPLQRVFAAAAGPPSCQPCCLRGQDERPGILAAAAALPQRLASPGLARTLAGCVGALALAAALPAVAQAAASAAAGSGGGGLAAMAKCERTWPHAWLSAGGDALQPLACGWAMHLCNVAPAPLPPPPPTTLAHTTSCPCSRPVVCAAPGRSPGGACGPLRRHHLRHPLCHCVCRDRWGERGVRGGVQELPASRAGRQPTGLPGQAPSRKPGNRGNNRPCLLVRLRPTGHGWKARRRRVVGARPRSPPPPPPAAPAEQAWW